ncbi:hypothetical protein SAMN04488118_1192 [Epibacterium ulvae]|uniref:Uncharacterized protein n=1 Tax=Epibacterium ulvae TaxID=1156985 RepID=A0A1G5RIZ3_9RHOB|nr:hypothetical protein [Epibacterium ulvae]SCZ73770.1 hypothetical protein SAMN04488118_1192 [Epibacterium ulvae]
MFWPDTGIEAFCKEYNNRLNALHREQNAARNSFITEQGKLTREKEKIVQSICDGGELAEMLKDRAVFAQTVSKSWDIF